MRSATTFPLANTKRLFPHRPNAPPPPSSVDRRCGIFLLNAQTWASLRVVVVGPPTDSHQGHEGGGGGPQPPVALTEGASPCDLQRSLCAQACQESPLWPLSFVSNEPWASPNLLITPAGTHLEEGW